MAPSKRRLSKWKHEMSSVVTGQGNAKLLFYGYRVIFLLDAKVLQSVTMIIYLALLKWLG